MEKHRRDVYCYECKKYFKSIDKKYSVCPECNSDDADVYPIAELYNRDMERKLLHKEIWLTSEICNSCGSKMIYRDDGYNKLFVCRNNKCNFTKPSKKASRNINDLKIKRLYVVD